MFIARYAERSEQAAENPDEAAVRRMVGELDDDNPALIVEESGTGRFAQALWFGAETLSVEVNDPEGEGRHRVEALSVERVAGALADWMAGVPREESGLAWEDVGGEGRRTRRKRTLFGRRR